jgi:hypothetical protein
MPPNPLLITLAALALGLQVDASAAQQLTDEELDRCQDLLRYLLPHDQPTEEQARCLAALAELGVFPAQGNQPFGFGLGPENQQTPHVNPNPGPNSPQFSND